MASTTVLPENGGGALPGNSTGIPANDTQTEDQILASVTGDDSSTVTTDDDAALDATTTDDTATADAAEDGKQKTADDADTDLEPGVIPPELAPLMRDDKYRPHIQRLVDQNRAYQAFGTVRDARKFAESFPGGVTEALNYRDRAFTLDSADEAFESGDENARSQLVNEWFERVPDATIGMLGTTMRILQQRDPARYGQLSGKIVQETFKNSNWDLQLASIADKISKLSAEQLADPVISRLAGEAQWLVEQAEKAGIKYSDKAKVSSEVDEISKRQQTFEQQQQQHQIERANFFTDAINTDVKSSLNRSINAKVGELLKNSAFSDKGKQRIASEILTGIEDKLKQDPAYKATLRQHIKEAGMSVSKRDKVVSFIVERSKIAMAAVAKQVIAEKTAELIADNKKANARKEGPGRVDITGGQSASARPRKLTAEQMRSMSDSDKDAYVDAHLGL